ncbi:hypothetical protein ACCS89_35305, partial [Rhizobium johnstonii]
RYRTNNSNQKPLERTQNWIKLGGKVTVDLPADLAGAYLALLSEREMLQAERDVVVAERDTVVAERDIAVAQAANAQAWGGSHRRL